MDSGKSLEEALIIEEFSRHSTGSIEGSTRAMADTKDSFVVAKTHICTLV